MLHRGGLGLTAITAQGMLAQAVLLLIVVGALAHRRSRRRGLPATAIGASDDRDA